MENNKVLIMEDISKAFNGVKVLSNVNLQVNAGEVHALIGANGAGKSTLMKVLNGIYTEYDGKIILNGKEIHFNNPWDAQQKGISMIHQELDLVMTMDVASNIFLGREETKGRIKHLDRKNMWDDAQALLDKLGFEINAHELAGNLSPANQQLVLVARSVSTDASIVVMDEPTSSLSYQETKALFRVIRQLKELGKSVIYISHYLEEIFEISDKVTVLRDGHHIITTNTSETTTEMLIERMIGQKANLEGKRLREEISDEIVLNIKNYSQKSGYISDIDLTLYKGEVLGLAGVVGSGRTELAKMIYGAEPIAKGQMVLFGKEKKIEHPFKAVKMGIAFVPEDRKKEGLIRKRSIGDNISLIDYRNHKKLGIAIDYDSAKKRVREMIDYMHTVCNSIDQEITDLSGGNQQKVIMGRCLAVSPKIMILDQPTRGVDVGAKSEIYDLIAKLAASGTSIILISDELEELLNLSDRILIMRRGRITESFNNHEQELNKNILLKAMVG